MTKSVLVRREKPIKYVAVWEHTPSVFWWQVGVMAFLLWGLLALDWIDHKTAGWWFFGTMALSMTAVSINLGRMVSIIILLVTGLATVSILLVEVKLQVPIFDRTGSFLRSLPMSYNATFGIAIGILAIVFFIMSVMHARIEGRWHLGRNTFEHYQAGTRDRGFPRAGKTVRTEYPDLVKFIMGLGCGNIVIAGGTRGEDVVARIEHVPFLVFGRSRRLRRMLESTAVTETEVVTAEQDSHVAA